MVVGRHLGFWPFASEDFSGLLFLIYMDLKEPLCQISALTPKMFTFDDISCYLAQATKSPQLGF